MSGINPIYTRALLALDLGLGILLLFWPGVWHELVHSWVERTTFYLVQGLGLILITRGLMALKTNVGAAGYGVGVPAVVFLAWITADTSSVALSFYLGLAVVWSLGAWWCRSTAV